MPSTVIATYYLDADNTNSISHRDIMLTNLLRLLATLVFLGVLVSGATAQIIETPSGPLEFIGLRTWTPQNLWDAIYRLAPGEDAHACGATLKIDFRFPDASVLAYGDTSGGIYWVVTVVEPEDSDRVRYLPVPMSSKPTQREWKSLDRSLRDNPNTEQIAIRAYGYVLRGMKDSAVAVVASLDEQMKQFGQIKSVGDAASVVWAFLGKHRSESDRVGAIATLKHDGNDTNRKIAALILSNFADHDDVWWALLDGQRDGAKTAAITSASSEVLAMFMRHFSRKIDWAPVVDSIRPFVAGTNLFAFSSTIEMLMGTKIDPALAPGLLKGNTHLLVSYLRAHHVDSREGVRKFLQRLKGDGPPANIDELIAWAESFQ